jgi:hypothetical protein
MDHYTSKIHKWAAIGVTFDIKPNEAYTNFPTLNSCPPPKDAFWDQVPNHVREMDKSARRKWWLEKAIEEWQSDVSYLGCLGAQCKDWRIAIGEIRRMFDGWNCSPQPPITSPVTVRPLILLPPTPGSGYTYYQLRVIKRTS